MLVTASSPLERLGLLRRTIDVWGTTITVDVPAGEDAHYSEALLDHAVVQMRAEAERIDAVYSPFQATSLVSRLRSGELSEVQLRDFGPDGDELLDVISTCRALKMMTDGAFDPWTVAGAFDPWAVVGGFDPCGYVKGWGAQRLVDVAVDSGLPNVCVNAAGDLCVAGSPDALGSPWTVGIAHPYRPGALCATLECQAVPQAQRESQPKVRAAVATSGYSEQRGHIVAPAGKAQKLAQVTVTGPNAGIADALATALLVSPDTNSWAWFDEFVGGSSIEVQTAPGAPSAAQTHQFAPQWGALIVDGDQLLRLGSAASR